MGDKEKERISQKGNIATEKGFLLSRRWTFPSVDIADADPLPLDRLFPQADFVIATGHSQNVARHGPWNVPNDVFEGMKYSLIPAARNPIIGPEDNSPILGAASNDRARESDGRRPGSVADPVRMALQLSLFNPFLVLTKRI